MKPDAGDYFQHGAMAIMAGIMLTITAPVWLPVTLFGWFLHKTGIKKVDLSETRGGM